MSEIVFILGAGASKEAGAPVMANFLDTADELRRGGKLGQFSQDFDRVFDAISELQAVHSKAQLNLDDIESVFAAFEMGRLTNRLPGIEANDIEPLLVSIRRLILKTLEQTVSYPIRSESIFPSPSYHSFAELVKELSLKGHTCSIITFNYDYALDYALNFNGIPADYCLPEAKSDGVIPLMKLHGSLNWARCSKCPEIIPWNIKDYSRIISLHPLASKRTTSVHLELSTSFSKSGLKHCEVNVDPDPVIVPPTWNKTEYHQVLSNVWARAASELSTAENVFVSGYSLNESDLFFRYLFALGSVGSTRIKRFWVFNPESEGIVDRRFRGLIGPSTEARYKYIPSQFHDMFNLISKEFKSL